MSKAYEILKVIAKMNAAGDDITLAHDWGLGSGTLVFKDGSHTHFGADIEDDERKAVDDFVNGLHVLLVEGKGLSVCPPEPPPEPLPGCDCPTCGCGHLVPEVPNYPARQCDHCNAKFPF